ncbi:SCO family protein [Sulfurimonas sp.]|uniref:SCO family protein n=1 Tax=Sulfurimonas sp. TaxID=2022749 RepID=UPI003562AD61
MQKKTSAAIMILLVIVVSVLIMIIPTFLTKGISRTSIHKEFELPLVLNDDKDIKLLFFGYSGCADICTPRMQDISTLYKSLSYETAKRVGIEFLDISTPDDKTLPNRFAHFFNEDFKGIYLDKNILREYTKVFSVYFSKSLMDKTEYDHTANLYLTKRSKNKKEIRYIYNSYPYDFNQIKLDIEELLHE